MDLSLGGPIAVLGNNGNINNSSGANARIPELNIACASESYTESDDGSYEWSIDFGTGCSIDEETLVGKIISRGVENEDGTFSDTTAYVNFGGADWTINGTEYSSGTYSEEEGSGSWTFDESLAVVFMGDTLNETLNIVASGRESYDSLTWTIESLSERIESNIGEIYTLNVESPLVMSLGCESDSVDVFIYVQGIEVETWSYENESGDYRINYGDGICDNIATVTEKGLTYTVDFSKAWDDWEKNDGSAENDEESEGDDDGESGSDDDESEEEDDAEEDGDENSSNSEDEDEDSSSEDDG